jgi:hypothetical protein
MPHYINKSYSLKKQYKKFNLDLTDLSSMFQKSRISKSGSRFMNQNYNSSISNFFKKPVVYNKPGPSMSKSYSRGFRLPSAQNVSNSSLHHSKSKSRISRKSNLNPILQRTSGNFSQNCFTKSATYFKGMKRPKIKLRSRKELELAKSRFKKEEAELKRNKYLILSKSTDINSTRGHTHREAISVKPFSLRSSHSKLFQKSRSPARSGTSSYRS